ncbi:MAG: C69 family dipeptidase [Bacteroidales bacterium]
MSKLNIALFLLTQFTLLLLVSPSSAIMPKEQEKGCFMIMAGKNATKDNSVLIAHNNDLTGEEISFLEKHPRMEHDSGEVVKFKNDLEIPQELITYEWMVLQTEKGFMEGDAVAVNEYGVAIGGGVSLAKDRNLKARKADPLKDKGVTGGIRYVALQRARTARQCVQILGKFFNSYGIGYPSGFAVADENEIWYVETGGGKHWAAIKIPSDACWIQANSYRIGFINQNDNDAMTSPGLKEFAKSNKLWDPENQLFNFAEVFGGRKRKLEKSKFSDSRRIWRAHSLLVPSKEISPERQKFPSFIRPDKKVTLEKLMSILRDEYRGTKFYPYSADTTILADTTYRTDTIYQADTIAQIDSVTKVDTSYQIDSSGRKERPIASQNAVHTSIVQIQEGFPSGLKSVLWAGLGSPVTTPYVPFYFGIEKIPDPYGTKTPKEKKAFHFYNKLSEIYYSNPPAYSKKFPDVFSNFQQRCINEQQMVNKQAYRMYRSSRKMTSHFLTVTVDGYCQEALDLVEENIDE